MSSCQLKIGSGFQVGAVSIFHLTARIPNGLDLCKPCVHCPSLFKFSCALVPLCLGSTVSSVSSIPTGSHNLPASSSTEFPEPQGEGPNGDTLSKNWVWFPLPLLFLFLPSSSLSLDLFPFCLLLETNRLLKDINKKDHKIKYHNLFFLILGLEISTTLSLA